MTNSLTVFDVIVIGGGINGLTAGAYLAKTGLSVAVIERRDQLGTHAVTEELTYPGFRTSSHATAINVGRSPCILDLELERFGLELTVPRFYRAMPFADGKAIVPDAYDLNNFYKKWLRFSQRDANVFKELVNAIVPLRLDFYQNFLYSAPSVKNFDWMVAQISKLPHVPADWWDMTGFELADLLFEDEHIKAWATSFSYVVGYAPDERVIGPLGVLISSVGNSIQQALGGAHQVPHALFRCLVHYGGKILQSCEVERIIIENGEAKGVALSKFSAYPEREIFAKKAIVSDLSPVPTFLHLVGEDFFDKQAARILKYQFDYDGHAIFTTSCMTTSIPDWKGTDFDPDLRSTFSFNVGVDSMADVERTVAQVRSDRIPNPINAIAEDFVLTVHDKTAAPPGYHNVQFWSDVPYNIRRLGGPEKWDDITKDTAQTVIDMVENYAPGFRKTLRETVALSPLDIFRKNPSAIKGTWTGGGRVRPGQFYFDRPFLGCNAPRTPIKRLYLSNGIWPPGTTSLWSGYIAAKEVIADLGINKPQWWSHKPFEWIQKYTERNKIEITPKVSL